jgi:hypothetical protein
VTEDPRQRAIRHGEEGDFYLTYLWLCIAADGGDKDAAEELEAMQEVEGVSPEDMTLAHFQLACWYRQGQNVDEDPDRALEHLVFAAVSAGYEVDADALARQDLAAALAAFRDQVGIPADVDLRKPLGPAMPDTPGNVNRRQLE